MAGWVLPELEPLLHHDEGSRMNAESEMAGADGLGAELLPPEGCTGAVMYDRQGRPSIQHDAGTCPIHEQGVEEESAKAIRDHLAEHRTKGS